VCRKINTIFNKLLKVDRKVKDDNDYDYTINSINKFINLYANSNDGIQDFYVIILYPLTLLCLYY